MAVRRSFVFIFGMIALVSVIFGIYFPVLTKYRNLRAEEEALDRKIAEIDKKIKVLNDERALLQNDRDYIEKVIRQELGLVKPGEIIYKFVTDALPSKPEAPKLPSAAVIEEPISGISGSQPAAAPETGNPKPN